MDAELSDLLTSRCSGLFRTVEADYIAKKDFYYSWGSRGGKLTVQISDYLQGAPDEVLGDFGEMIALRALGLEWSEPDSFLDYVRSDDYIVSRRPLFIKRSRNLLRTDVGEARFLPDSVQRLMDAGLIGPQDIENSVISWTRRDSHRRIGRCSTMLRVVGISLALDTLEASDDAVDYVVYHECLHLRQGYLPTRRVHDAEFHAWEHEYPGWRECEAVLRGLGDMRGQHFYPLPR